MSSEFAYSFTEKAASDIESTLHYLALEKENKAAVRKFMAMLEKALSDICLFPESSPIIVNEFAPSIGVRKKLMESYAMYYIPDINKRIICVLRIIPAKMEGF